MIRSIVKAARKIEFFLSDHFAPYGVRDCMGTIQTCWTLKQAEAWLPYCGPRAVIYETLSREVIVSRSFVRVN